MARPELTKRDRVYELLHDAGELGVSVQEFTALGIHCPRVHIESLDFETGLSFEARSGYYEDERGVRRSELRFYLVRDEWAAVPEHEARQPRVEHVGEHSRIAVGP